MAHRLTDAADLEWELEDTQPRIGEDTYAQAAAQLPEPRDDDPEWEQQLSAEDVENMEEWDYHREWAASIDAIQAELAQLIGAPADNGIWRQDREHCRNCKLPKPPFRSSGRCYGCEKHWQRHHGERPLRLIAKEIRRTLARDEIPGVGGP
jgi:hypothetical protein